jgi:hypothetical protein
MLTTQPLDYLYLKMPGTEPVTVTTIRGVGKVTKTAIPVSNAWQRSVTEDDVTNGYVRSKSEGQTWHIPAVLLNGAEIKNGDTITNSEEEVWTVMSTECVRMKTHWRCVCRREK